MFSCDEIKLLLYLIKTILLFAIVNSINSFVSANITTIATYSVSRIIKCASIITTSDVH